VVLPVAELNGDGRPDKSELEALATILPVNVLRKKKGWEALFLRGIPTLQPKEGG
jgi:hypothetical protein